MNKIASRLRARARNKDKNQLSAKIPSNVEITDAIGFNYKDLLIFDKNKIRIKI